MAITSRLLLFVFCMCIFASAKAETIKLYTVDYPPFQIFDLRNGRSGYSIEVVEKALVMAGLEFVYVDMPWARAQKTVEHEPNSLIFTLAKTKPRLSQFVWVDNIYQVSDGLYALTSREDIRIGSLADVNNYSIALPNGDASIQKLGISVSKNETLFVVNSQELAISMLKMGRVDLNFNNEVGFFSAVDKMKLSRKLFKKVYITQTSDMGIATSAKTDDAILAKIRGALRQMRSSGQLQQLKQKWFSESN